MKRCSLILLFFFFFSISYSQINPRSYIAIQIGPAFPAGDFVDDAYNNEKSGFAKTGINLNLLNIGYKFHKLIGVSAFWTESVFPFDKEEYESILNSSYQGAVYYVDSKGWKYGAILAGIFLSVGDEVMEVDFRAAIGSSYAKSPKITATGFTGLSHADITLDSDRSTAIAYSLGIGIRILLSSKISLNIFGDYLKSDHNFEVEMKESYSDYSDVNKMDQPIRIINLSTGIGFRF